jgi:hypothetical protein
MGERDFRCKWLESHPYRRHTSTPTQFADMAAICPIFSTANRHPSQVAPSTHPVDGINGAIVEICVDFERIPANTAPHQALP